MPRGGSLRRQQLRDRSRREPAGDAQVLTVSRGAEQTSGAHDPTCAGRRPHALVLNEEAQVATYVLAEHAAAVRGAVDVHELRVGREPDLPGGLAEAKAPVRLLAEQEEVLVERPDAGD